MIEMHLYVQASSFRTALTHVKMLAKNKLKLHRYRTFHLKVGHHFDFDSSEVDSFSISQNLFCTVGNCVILLYGNAFRRCLLSARRCRMLLSKFATNVRIRISKGK